MPLHFKDKKVHVLNYKDILLKRLNGLKARINKETKLKEEYSPFLTDMIAKGYAENVSIDKLSIDDGTVLYILRSGV